LLPYIKSTENSQVNLMDSNAVISKSIETNHIAIEGVKKVIEVVEKKTSNVLSKDFTGKSYISSETTTQSATLSVTETVEEHSEASSEALIVLIIVENTDAKESENENPSGAVLEAGSETGGHVLAESDANYKETSEVNTGEKLVGRL
jgi:hypothetical protein